MNVKVKLLTPTAKMPVFGSEEAGGFDLSSANDEFWIKPGGTAIVSTGLAFEIPKGHILRVSGRSGLAFKHGIWAFEGTVDSDYRSEVKLLLHNFSPETFHIQTGDRVAQGIIIPVLNQQTQLRLTQVDELSVTQRGSGGFGSTGK